MDNTTQVFQSGTSWRKHTYQWILRSFLVLIILALVTMVVTYQRARWPNLPQLGSTWDGGDTLVRQVRPVSFTARDMLMYHGFSDYLSSRRKIASLIHHTSEDHPSQIRSAFYVDWDPQSFYSLQGGVDKMNIVFPEWFFIDPTADTLKPEIDLPALNLMRQHHIKILPLVNNINDRKDGGFDPALIHRILHDRAKRQRLVRDMVRYVELYGLQGINVDFEEFRERSDEPIVSFQQEIYEAFHARGLLVTQDVMASNEDFNLEKLSKYNDYLILMAYDEHWSTSVPGPVSNQKWIEKIVDLHAKEVPANKIILGIAGYGYDWPSKGEAETVSYQEALAKARVTHARIEYDNDSYSLHFSYTDGRKIRHDVYFNDAASNFNTIRFSDEYGLAGTALWRLGSEDPRIWKFYKMPLDNAAIAKAGFDLRTLERADDMMSKPDYIGDGEVLDVVSSPDTGLIRLEKDSIEQIITEEYYDRLPTRYVIRKFGRVDRQVVLTFDDGPDPVYTPEILDILRAEKVPAVFFVVGLEAERNLPLLRRISREGHEIGNHTFTHPNMAEVGLERAASEMETTRLLIEAVTGRSTVLFRAPYNADAEPSSETELRPVVLSKAQDYYTVGESIDPNDWELGVNADSIYARTIRQYEMNPSKGIILLHDAGGDRRATVLALPRIIQYFKKRHISFTSLSGLLKVDRDRLMPPVQGRLLSLDAGIAESMYWVGQLLTSAFWVAIMLGLIRITAMGAMAAMRRRQERRMGPPAPIGSTPPLVSIIVPAYNEEVTAVQTVRNLLQQDYPSLEIIFVDDGSRDQTYSRVREAFAGEPFVRMITKVNGGKSSALNEGIRLSRGNYLVCIDADTQLHTDAVRKLMERILAGPDIGAVAGNVKVGNARTILAKWQSIEYTTAQNFDRRAFDLVNGITVVPGAIGAFRKEAVEAAGGFTTDTLAEDCDLTIRIIRQGYRVVNCTEAIAVTEVPETTSQFMKQRFRWTYGVMQAFWKHRDACFNPAYKGLGLLSLPNILLFQIILPILAPLADIMLVLSLVLNRSDSTALQNTWTFYLIFLAVDLLVSLVAFYFEKAPVKVLWWLLPQRFVYRQLMYVILFRSIGRAIKGESQGWGTLKRTGHATMKLTPTPSPLTTGNSPTAIAHSPSTAGQQN